MRIKGLVTDQGLKSERDMSFFKQNYLGVLVYVGLVFLMVPIIDVDAMMKRPELFSHRTFSWKLGKMVPSGSPYFSPSVYPNSFFDDTRARSARRAVTLDFAPVSLLSERLAGELPLARLQANQLPLDRAVLASHLADFAAILKANNENHPVAIVVGAGVAGLMSALQLEKEGYRVAVIEKRSLQFSRQNVVNITMDIDSELHKLGLLDKFVKEVAQPLEFQRLSVTQEGHKILAGERFLTLDVNEVGKLAHDLDLAFEVENLRPPADNSAVKNVLGKAGVYSIPIAQFQAFLAHCAEAKKIPIMPFVEAEFPHLPARDSHNDQPIEVSLQNEGNQLAIKADLVVLADGASGQTLREYFPMIEQANHPCAGEGWVFGNFAYYGNKGFVSSILEYEKADHGKPKNQIKKMINAIFNGKYQILNIAVHVPCSEMTQDQIKATLIQAAGLVFECERGHSTIELGDLGDLKDFNPRVVKIVNGFVEHPTAFDRIILVGDRAGTSSPLAGLGASTAATTTPFAVRKLAGMLKQCGKVTKSAAESDKKLYAKKINNAFERFGEIVKTSAQLWCCKAKGIKNLINYEFGKHLFDGCEEQS
jgi:2-polyprenyl-6-methoxyphenol hydroxylase-like FAD-dependent oxidoreductase